MENKLREKKIMLEVLEGVLSGMEWTIKQKSDEIEQYNQSMKEDPENVREWEKQTADNARAYLEAWEQVKKHLEKLM